MADPGVEGEGRGDRARVSIAVGEKLGLLGLLGDDLTALVCRGLGAAFR